MGWKEWMVGAGGEVSGCDGAASASEWICEPPLAGARGHEPMP